MKRVKIILIASLLFAIVLSVSGFVIYGKGIAPQTHMMTYKDKLQTLSELEGPKAVFIGGSSTHFSVSAELFEKETGIRAVNMGLHMAISLDKYLSQAERFLSDGDIVFLIPEYDYYCTEWRKYDKQNSEFAVLYGDVNLLEYSLESAEAFPNLIYTGWSEWESIIKQIISLLLFEKTNENYSRYDSDKWGDFVGYCGSGQISPRIATYDDYNEESYHSLINSIKEFEQKGIKVFLLFPPYAGFAFDENRKVITSVYEALKNENLNLLFEPECPRYNDKYFYDTVYHLNADGKEIYTWLIINRFNAYEQNYSIR